MTLLQRRGFGGQILQVAFVALLTPSSPQHEFIALLRIRLCSLRILSGLTLLSQRLLLLPQFANLGLPNVPLRWSFA